jgi:hypothetical protein
MNWIKEKIIGILVKKYVAGWIASLFAKAKGYKTQIGTVLIVGIIVAKNFGIIPAEFMDIADQILTMLYGATGISAGEKLRRFWEQAKAAGDEAINKQ